GLCAAVMVVRHLRAEGVPPCRAHGLGDAKLARDPVESFAGGGCGSTASVAGLQDGRVAYRAGRRGPKRGSTAMPSTQAGRAHAYGDPGPRRGTSRTCPGGPGVGVLPVAFPAAARCSDLPGPGVVVLHRFVDVAHWGRGVRRTRGLRCRGAVGAGAAALLLGSAGALHGLLRLHFVGRPATAVRNVSAPNADGAPPDGYRRYAWSNPCCGVRWGWPGWRRTWPVPPARAKGT